MPSARRLALSITVVAFALLMSACTAPPAAAPAPVGTPTPTETAVPAVEGPTPVFDVGCEELVDRAELQAFIGAGVAPIALVTQGQRVATVYPDVAALDQLGSLACDWIDGQQWASPWGPPPEGRQSVHLSLVPDAEAAAQRYVDTYAATLPVSPYGATAQGPRCIGIEETMTSGYCELHGWLADAWIEFVVNGIDTTSYASNAELLAAFTTFTDRAIASLDDAEQVAAWTPPVSPNPVSDCASILTTEDVVELTGITEVYVGPQWDGPRIGQYSYAADTEQAMRCSFNYLEVDGWFGATHVLPEGAWGFTTASPAWLAEGGVQADVEGLEAGDAVIRCTDPADNCTLDMRVAEHWIRVEVMPPPPADVSYVPAGIDFEAARAAVVPIADRIVANVTAG